MPRIARTLGEDCIYHVTNHGRGGQELFRGPHDYLAFLDLLMVARERYNLQLYAFCLLPNHFHLLIKPDENAQLSYGMQWLQTSYARRFKDYYKVKGPLWQERFRSCPVQENTNLHTVMHFIENHPLRAGLAEQAMDYVWSSHRENYLGNVRQKLDEPPLPLNNDWPDRVNRALHDHVLQQLSLCTRRQLPYGSAEWQQKMCDELGIKASFKPRGRPRKHVVTMLLAGVMLLGWFGALDAQAADFHQIQILKISAPEQAAVLLDANGEPKLVRVGDMLTADTRITAIDDQRVIMQKRGKQGDETVVATLDGPVTKVEREGSKKSDADLR